MMYKVEYIDNATKRTETFETNDLNDERLDKMFSKMLFRDDDILIVRRNECDDKIVLFLNREKLLKRIKGQIAYEANVIGWHK